MPNKRAAMKDLRQTKKRLARNTRSRTNVKHSYKEVGAMVQSGKAEDAKRGTSTFQQIADKAAKGRAIHPNKARRMKSRLMKRLAKSS